MYSPADGAQAHQSQAVANELLQKQSSDELSSDFLDMRPEALAQRQLKKQINESQQSGQTAQLLTVLNNPATLQLKANSSESQPMQMAAGDEHHFAETTLTELAAQNSTLYHGTVSRASADSIVAGIVIPSTGSPGMHELGFGFYTAGSMDSAVNWATYSSEPPVDVFVVEIAVTGGVLANPASATALREAQLSTLPDGVDGVSIGGEQAWGKAGNIAGGAIYRISVDEDGDSGDPVLVAAAPTEDDDGTGCCVIS